MILVPTIRVKEFTKTISKFKAVQPIKINSPDSYILPESLLNDKEILKALPELKDLELINEKDIVFIESEI